MSNKRHRVRSAAASGDVVSESGTGAVYGRKRTSAKAWRPPRQIAGLSLAINGTRKSTEVDSWPTVDDSPPSESSS